MLEYGTVPMMPGRDRACGCRANRMRRAVRFPVRSEPELQVMRDTDSGRCAWRSLTGLLSCQPAEAGGADRVDQLKLHPVVVSWHIIGRGVDVSDKLGYVAAVHHMRYAPSCRILQVLEIPYISYEGCRHDAPEHLLEFPPEDL